MTTIKITSAFNNELEAIRSSGKTPWVIINEDYAVGAYSSRTEARADKMIDQLRGKIMKADEVNFEVVDLAATGTTGASQVLADEIDERDPTEAELEESNRPEPVKAPVLHKSTTSHPCKLVWVIADQMIGKPRKEVLAECVKQGVAYYTARTQYQQWLSIRKEMAVREAAQQK